MLACDTTLPEPISVVDIAARAEIGTHSFGISTSSVEVGSDGSVLVTEPTFFTGVPPLVRRLTLGPSGVLTDTGETLALPPEPTNSYVAPDGRFGIALAGETATSYSIPGLAPADTTDLASIPREFSVTGAFDPAGEWFYVKNGSFVSRSTL